MGMIVDIVEPDTVVTNEIANDLALTIDVSPSIVTDVLVQDDPVVIEVLAGLPGQPGVQNVFVGTTPPSNPQENWIWVDTNG